jgi:uncharacterized protein (DUF305 family)
VSRSRRIAVVAAVAAVVGAAVVAGVVAGAADDGGDDEGDDVRVVQPGAPGEESRELSDDEADDVTAPEHGAEDTAFMQNMIAHHGQALAMTVLVEERTDSRDISLLAERITVSQEAEIELMEEWLTDRDEVVPDPADHAQHERMPGMATPAQLAELEAARGTAFDRLFLELMIAHHQGALTMVTELYGASGGLEPAADFFARGVEADQTIEIQRMEELQAEMA